MTRSAEALRRRASKRDRTLEEQRKAEFLASKRKRGGEGGEDQRRGSNDGGGTTPSEKPPPASRPPVSAGVDESPREPEKQCGGVKRENLPQPRDEPASAAVDESPREQEQGGEKARVIPPQRHEQQRAADDPLNEPGVWTCTNCDNRNFASRATCHSTTCEERRPPEATKLALEHQKEKNKNKRQRRGARQGFSGTTTGGKPEWGAQASDEQVAKNQDLRKQYRETGGDGMDEGDVTRAKALIERDERKQAKKALRASKKASRQ